MSYTDLDFLHHALRIGARHQGRTWPNPSVGCVLVKNQQVLAFAATAESGRPHAETQALANAGAQARGGHGTGTARGDGLPAGRSAGSATGGTGGVTNPLAPLTGLVSTVTGTLGGATGGAASGAIAGAAVGGPVGAASVPGSRGRGTTGAQPLSSKPAVDHAGSTARASKLSPL